MKHNHSLTQSLHLLFELSPPERLRKLVTALFFDYMSRTPADSLPQDFPEKAEDIWFLIRFLEKAEKECKM